MGAPAGADKYRVNIRLIFHLSVLKSVMLVWAFQAGLDRRLAGDALAREVTESYAPELYKQSIDRGYGEWASILMDRSANGLMVGQSLSAGMVFLWYFAPEARWVSCRLQRSINAHCFAGAGFMPC